MGDLLLVIGNKNYSSWSLRPWLLLRHLDVPFAEHRIPLFTDQRRDQIAQYSTTHKVPVLWDGDRQVWDSLAICEYVSERYAAHRGWPSDSEARAPGTLCQRGNTYRF